MTNKSKATTKSANTSTITAIKGNTSMQPENTLRFVFQPLFSPKQPIIKDELGKELEGTGLLIFQGATHSLIEWTDKVTGEQKSNPKYSFVFAVKALDGSYKNIGVKCNYTYQPGNLLSRMLEGLKISDFILTTSDGDDEFGTIKNLDCDLITEKLVTLQGLAFYGEFKYVVRNGYPIYQLEPETLKPRLDKDGNQQRVQEILETNPNAVYAEIGE